MPGPEIPRNTYIAIPANPSQSRPAQSQPPPTSRAGMPRRCGGGSSGGGSGNDGRSPRRTDRGRGEGGCALFLQRNERREAVGGRRLRSSPVPGAVPGHEGQSRGKSRARESVMKRGAKRQSRGSGVAAWSSRTRLSTYPSHPIPSREVGLVSTVTRLNQSVFQIVASFETSTADYKKE
ncbi:hypothetical protein BDY21DRAFT_205011 [Lineolata rhizophorae]|uniref:Uncharacterized protein n=1 Tax=Lineolata rhizophorae TaxID=578093 RepID=A0A6A6P420_9PEZI|nr:hypothetical protein BDY21DRAFT_205011 [Lineolata rhizophorae]